MGKFLQKLCIFRYYHYSAHSVADCMEDVTLLETLLETDQNEKLEEEDGEVEAIDDASEKDEL